MFIDKQIMISRFEFFSYYNISEAHIQNPKWTLFLESIITHHVQKSLNVCWETGNLPPPMPSRG